MKKGTDATNNFTEVCAWCFKEHQVQKMIYLGHYNIGQGDYSGFYCLECVEEALQTILNRIAGLEILQMIKEER